METTTNTPKSGDPCPNGCTQGYGAEEEPTPLEVAEYPDDHGNIIQSPDGDITCPTCWAWFGDKDGPA